MATVTEVDTHVRQAWSMEIDTRNFFAAAATAGGGSGSGSEIGSVDDHTELHAAFVRHGTAHPRQPQRKQDTQQTSTVEERRWGKAPLAEQSGATARRQATQVGTDHVAELARRKAALEAEIAAVRARGNRYGS